MEKHCLVVYISGFFFSFLFSKCLTDVALFLFWFFLHLSIVYMTKASRCLMDLICKPHHHWTRHNVAVILLIIFRFLSVSFSVPPTPHAVVLVSPPVLLSLQSVLWKWPLSHATLGTTSQSRLHFPDASIFWGFFANEVFCAWSADHSFTEGKKKQLQPIAMHLTQTGISLRPLGYSDLQWSHRKISHVVTISPHQWDHPSVNFVNSITLLSS